jgi:hypothetical protein
VGLFALAFAAVSGLAWSWLGPIAAVPSLALALGILLAVQLELARRASEERRSQAAQTQHFLALQMTLGADRPLPQLGGYAMEPDCAAVLARHVLDHRPRLIVEAGCGGSTIVAAYGLRRLGSGKIVALEHFGPWAAEVRRDLAMRGLDSFAEVRDAPLERQAADGEEWDWFAVQAQGFDEPIDLLVVDGPPAVSRRDARFPALPLLARKLSRDAFILCDDAHRRAERLVLERWKRLFPEIEIATLPTKRGTALIRVHPRERGVRA